MLNIREVYLVYRCHRKIGLRKSWHQQALAEFLLPCDLQDELKKVYEEAVLSNLPSDAEDDDPGLPNDIYLALQHLSLQLLPEDVSNRLQLIMRHPKLRDDGWFEIELGEFYTENEDDHIEMNLKELKECASLKTGLIVEGIEIRPRMD
ncbi:hypothetical protein R3W88_027191 [Solanum pinnatisectum]|uniref:Uncharacterized protein n=1 Tax=Solanum pinnatisectum TaxID=50273 RepID=A0AAV9LGJ3_9SOLN|nr:hypothetical protein R3W88_027191 [Solanum pinnatisectum]